MSKTTDKPEEEGRTPETPAAQAPAAAPTQEQPARQPQRQQRKQRDRED